jgi:hypothetical protein
VNTTKKAIVFGIISGLLWSLIAGSLVDLFNSATKTVFVLFAGALTGAVVSLILKAPLIRFSWGWTFIGGFISLPLGAFIFGNIMFFGGLGEFNGAEFAVLSVISLFAIILIPLAIITTFILGVIIRSNDKSGKVIE